MYQKTILIGYIGGDPEMRYTGTGTEVTSVNFPITKRWQGQDGQWNEDTFWVKLTGWKQQAVRLAENLMKGDMVVFEAEIEKPTVYTNRNGEVVPSLGLRVIYFKRLVKGAAAKAASGNGYQQEAAPQEDDYQYDNEAANAALEIPI